MGKITHFRIKYEGSKGQQALDGMSVILSNSDIMRYSWGYDMSPLLTGKGSVLTRFYKEIEQFRLETCVWGNDKEELHRKIDNLVALSETDVISKVPGKLHINDEYLVCYITSFEVTELSYVACKVNMVITAPQPFWIEEVHRSYFLGDSDTAISGRRYPRKYLDKYIQDGSGNTLINDGYSSSSIKLTIYGPVEKPIITIAGHPYIYDDKIETGERVEIDQVKRTVTKFYANGAKENAFHKRGKEYSVFKPIDSGNNLIISSGGYGFDIVLYKERSIPKWLGKENYE